MIKRLFRGATYRFLYRTWAGRVVLDHMPWKTRFYDGTVHKVPYRIHRIFQLWRDSVPLLARESKAVFDEYHGGDFIDIGAFNGWYSLLIAPKAKPGDSFVSVEPDQACVEDLAKTLRTLREIYPRVSFEQIQRAVGDGSPIDIVKPQGEVGHPSFRSVRKDDANPVAESLTIDRLVKQNDLHPSFIKVDVEGAEYEVLQGARNTFQKFHPALMTELHPDWLPKGITIDVIAEYLKSFSYVSTPIDGLHVIWK